MVFAGVELLGQDVKRLRMLAEVANVENSFGVRQIQSAEVGVKASVGGAKVGY